MDGKYELTRNAGLRYSIDDLGQVLILTFLGDLDEEHEEELKLVLMRAVDEPRHMLLHIREGISISKGCSDIIASAYRNSVIRKRPLMFIGEVDKLPAM